MRTHSNLIAIGIATVLVPFAAFLHGCGRGSPKSASADAPEIMREVTTLLNRWTNAFESRDLDGVRSVLAEDKQFIWLEDGEPRYRSVDAIVNSLASFPPDLAFTHALGDVQIVPISEGAAWAHVATSTKIEHSGRTVSEFTSVVLMIIRRDESEWRIHAAHTSTSKPRSPTQG